MENGASAPLEQMLNFPWYFQSIQNFTYISIDFFQCYLKIDNDVMIYSKKK